MKPSLNLGAWRELGSRKGGRVLGVPAAHFVTHGVVVGMTGSGKTGPVTVLIEEAARAQVPTIVVDVKGDLPNLLLASPSLDAHHLEPWLEGATDEPTSAEVTERAAAWASERRTALAEHGVGEAELADHARRTHVRVLTPGSSAGWVRLAVEQTQDEVGAVAPTGEGGGREEGVERGREVDLLGGTAGDASSINDRGDIVGYAIRDVSFVGMKWVGRRSTPVVLATIEGGVQPWPQAINERGLIVGWDWPPERDMAAIAWTSPADVRLLPLDPAGRAYDVNDRGQVVGDWNWRAFLLQPGKRHCHCN